MKRCLPKVCGADMELGNFVDGAARTQGTGYEASRLLLSAIDGFATGLPHHAGSGYGSGLVTQPDSLAEGSLSQDWGRKFLRNGGCAYVDLNHLEVCIPEVTSAYDHLAASHAMLQLAHQAAEEINRRLRPGLRMVVLANNSDGLGHSYGTHLNFLLSRPAWEDLFHHRIQFQLFLAAYQASSIALTGLGKVGSENHRPPVDYQISQRADFFEILTGVQTTYNRPLVNSRDEALCGDDSSQDLARLHVIFYDNNLCHTAGLLKVGVLQIVLAMIEAGEMDSGLLLDSPVEAVLRWSHDPHLRTRARLVSGRERTAVELQLGFFDRARRFVEAGRCDPFVPHAGELLDLWGWVLERLEQRDFAALTPHLDWVLKKAILEQALRENPALRWDSPEIKRLDHLYSSLDPKEGLFQAYDRAGLVAHHVTTQHTHRFLEEPPSDTRAWTRGYLLRLADPADIDTIDWDSIRFQFFRDNRWPMFRRLTLSLPNPLRATRAEIMPRLPEAATLETLLECLGATEYHPVRTPSTTGFTIITNPAEADASSAQPDPDPNPKPKELEP